MTTARAMNPGTLPLFPLPSVLFPGGRLSLRIFERRYLDMIRECARNETGFGVCLVMDAHGPDRSAATAAIGTVAAIVDFNVLEDGLLGIVAQGTRRFRVRATHVRDSGLIVGEVELFEQEPEWAIPAEYGLLATILARYHEKAGGDHVHAEKSRYDDSAWVAYRLAEALPLELQERQSLLQMPGPFERLDQLMRWLPRFQSA